MLKLLKMCQPFAGRRVYARLLMHSRQGRAPYRDTFAIDLTIFTLFRSAIQILAFFTIIPYFYEHIYDNIFEKSEDPAR
jgi:hypothetical protein